jgi:triphosphatase
MEVEAKLAAPSGDVLEQIAKRSEIAGLHAAPRPLEPLETSYLDTPDRTLQKARVAVRIRRAPGGVELTVKRPGEHEGHVHRRPEWTIALPAAPEFPWAGNAELLAELGPLELHGGLSPIIETLVRRRPIDLRDADGNFVAELALDEVRFRRPSGRGDSAESAASFEVEVELRDGDEAVLARVVEALRRDYPLEPARLSKLERALRWAGLDR